MSKNPVYTRSFLAGLKPDPLMTISQWADAKRVLPSKSSAEPGRWRTSRTPYLREIMDELSPQSPTEEVKVIKATQLGFTELGNNAMMCYMDLYPCPIQMIMPTEKLALKHSKAKLTPSIKMVPSLMAKVKDGKTKDDAGGTTEKEFDGGMLSIGWSYSAASFASFSARFVDLDDVDRFPDDVEGEGSPVDLGRNRADAFSNRKIYINSTPTIKGGAIDREYDDSDQREYNMPCPRCGEHIVFDFSEEDQHFVFTWDQERYELTSGVQYRCPHCEGLIEEHEKTWMMDEENGAEWIPNNPGHHHRGYKLNSFYSPIGWVSWVSIVREWVKAKKAQDNGDNSLMKRFWNTRLAKPWEETFDSTPADDMLLLRNDLPKGIVPNDTFTIAMAVDVQLDHFWVKVAALKYGAGKHFLFNGRVETWADIERVLYTQWEDKNGGFGMVSICAVDSGFKRDEVYEFCAMHSDICIPVKGASGKPKSPWIVSNVERDIDGRTIATGLKLYVIDTEYFKDMLHSQVQRSIEMAKRGEAAHDNLLSVHSEADHDWAKQMTSEYKHCEVNKKTGAEKWDWRKISPKADNHQWDDAVYITFLGELIGIRFMQRESIAPKREERRQRPSRSSGDYTDNY